MCVRPVRSVEQLDLEHPSVLLLGHLNFHLSEQTRSLEPVCSFRQCYMVPDSFHSGIKFLSSSSSFFFFF